VKLKQWEIVQILLNARVTINDEIFYQIERSPLKQQVKLIKILLKNYPKVFDETMKSFLKVAVESKRMSKFIAGQKKYISFIDDPLKSIFEAWSWRNEMCYDLWLNKIEVEKVKKNQRIFPKLCSVLISPDKKKLLPVLTESLAKYLRVNLKNQTGHPLTILENFLLTGITGHKPESFFKEPKSSNKLRALAVMGACRLLRHGIMNYTKLIELMQSYLYSKEPGLEPKMPRLSSPI
jgi:hypothetical protein